MQTYAILITFMFALLLGAVLQKEYTALQAKKNYQHWLSTTDDQPAGKRIKTEADVFDGLDDNENRRMNEIKDELGATVLSHRRD